MILVAPPVDSALVDPDIVAGRWLTHDSQRELVAADAIYLTYPDIEPGDRLRLKVGDRREEEWILAGIFRFTNQLDDIFVASPDRYALQ